MLDALDAFGHAAQGRGHADEVRGVDVHADRLDDLRTDVALDLGRAPERAATLVRQAWRTAEEFNVNTGLWLDALFVQLRRAFA